MHFSLDWVVGLAATDKLSFQLKFKEFTALLETYNEILERDIAFMQQRWRQTPRPNLPRRPIRCRRSSTANTTT